MFHNLLASALLAAVSLQGVVTMPVSYMSRGETVMSLILARIPDMPVTKNTGQFSDVFPGDPYEPYILYAEKLGIIQANATRELHPDASVTRAEFLKMLSLTFGLQVGYSHTFTDVPSGSWFEPYAGLASRYNLFGIGTSATLEPQRVVTRDDVIQAITAVQKPETPTTSVRIERNLAKDQADGKLTIYTRISTRREKVTLVSPQKPQAPLPIQSLSVRRTKITSSLPDIRTQVLTLVNAIRIQKRMQPLTYSAQLEMSAQAYADRMVKENFFAHVAPDGQTLKDRIMQTGYYNRSFSPDCRCVKGFALGENLARGPKTAKEAVDAWMKSPDHRAAILNPDYTHLGVGINAGYWVQHFGGMLVPEVKQ